MISMTTYHINRSCSGMLESRVRFMGWHIQISPALIFTSGSYVCLVPLIEASVESWYRGPGVCSWMGEPGAVAPRAQRPMRGQAVNLPLSRRGKSIDSAGPLLKKIQSSEQLCMVF